MTKKLDDAPDLPSPICSIPRSNLMKIQTGTMKYTWGGVLCNKDPFELALYPMLIFAERPATIIEIGSKEGGSALWLDDVCIRFGLHTSIISIDINQRAKVRRRNISFEQCDGRELDLVLTPKRMANLIRPLLVVEDADHHYLTTRAVIEFMGGHLFKGEYLVIEDGICNSMGNESNYDGGPNRAISEMLEKENPQFSIDRRYCDYYGFNVTWNTNGYLRKT